MQKCAICPKYTDKCCSLCRKVFYCSSQHQQVHWHTTHKFHCEGKNPTADMQQQNFKIYNQPLSKSLYQAVKNNEQDAKIFIELFQDRLVLRKNVLFKYLTAKQSHNSPQLNKELVKQCIQLHEVSKKITQSYRTAISDILQDSYGLITNNFIVKMDQILDKVLLARCYQLCFMTKELKEILMVIGNETDPFPQHAGQQFIEAYKKLLISVIDISEQANFDKITQKMYANFIKLVQKIDGIWQQSYAYYNMGLWYAKKTYYQKAVKCFSYCIDLVANYKLSKQALDNSIVFKGDSLYNIAICRRSLGEKEKSIQNMQESYRLRAQGHGKSSLEASNSLFVLSQWCLEDKKYQSCLQYVVECLRIRKTNPTFARQLQQVHNLIKKIYQQIRKQKKQNQQAGNMRNSNYYDRLLQSQDAYKQPQAQKRQSFTKKLLQKEKDLVVFKLVITPELAEDFTSQQWFKLGELIDLQDKQMDKQKASELILQSPFTLSLNEEQKKMFIKLNKIG